MVRGLSFPALWEWTGGAIFEMQLRERTMVCMPFLLLCELAGAGRVDQTGLESASLAHFTDLNLNFGPLQGQAPATSPLIETYFRSLHKKSTRQCSSESN